MHVEGSKQEKFKLIHSSKFKHTYLSFDLYLPYSLIDLSNALIMPYILGQYANKYPSKEKMRAKKDELYAPSLSCKTSLRRDLIVISIDYKFLNPKYVSGVSFKDHIDFLMDCLFEPYLDDNILKEIILNYQASVKRQLDKPEVYAFDRMLELVGQDTYLAYRKLDRSKEVASLSVESFFIFYKKLLERAECYLAMIGEFDDDTFAAFLKRLNLDKRPHYARDRNAYDLKDRGEVIEERELSQSTLLMYYEFPLVDDFLKRVTYMLADGLFGALPSSLLFDDIREKRGLCYSIYSNLNFNDAGLYVFSALSYKDKDEAIKAVKSDLEYLISSTYVREHLDVAKEYYRNLLLSSNDYASSILAFNLKNMFLKRDISYDEYIACIDKVDAEMVVQALNELQLKIIYVLKGSRDE